MAEMLVDSTKLDACLDAEADAIRAKTGDSNGIPFDFANNKGFADAIAAIPSDGGGSSSDIVTVGENSVTNTYSARNYLISLSSLDFSNGKYAIQIISGYENPVYNQIGAFINYNTEYTGSLDRAKRYRNGWSVADITGSFDAVLVVGSMYKITVLE